MVQWTLYLLKDFLNCKILSKEEERMENQNNKFDIGLMLL